MYGTVFVNDSSKLIFLYGIFMALIGFINLQIFYFISMKKYWYLIYLFTLFIVEIILIFNYHNTLMSVLWIEILISSFIFFVNTIMMLILSKRRRILKHG